jgi:anti-sigma B factor antagonist
LNLGGVSHIDSNGLGELVASHTTVSRNGGQIKLLNLTSRVQDLLSICRLSTVFETFDSEADALHSFVAVTAP